MSSVFTIGIDLGGTQVRAALVDAEGNIIQRASAATDVAGGPQAVIAQFEQLVNQVCSGDALRNVAGIGISAPGPLDGDAGVVFDIPTLPGWQDFPLRDEASRRFGLPVALQNDGIAAAYGEWKFGAGRGLKHLVYVTVSTGIGGGVVVDGRLMLGHRGMGGHVGHMRLALDGPPCSCGTSGCFEAFAAGSALDRATRIAAQAHPASLLGRMARTARLTAGDAVQAAREGDETASWLMDREAEYLGAGFVALMHLYSPEIVIMGGGVSQAFDLLAPGITRVVRRTAMHPFRDIPVVKAALGGNSGLVGAAALSLPH